MVDQGAFEFLDQALNAGEMLDWMTPTISLINYAVGSHVGYGVYVNGVSSKYFMSIGDLRAIFRERGVDFCCSSIMGAGEQAVYYFDVPIEQQRWCEHIMDRYGVAWWGGLTSWADWLRNLLGMGQAQPYEDGAGIEAGFGAGALAPAF